MDINLYVKNGGIYLFYYVYKEFVFSINVHIIAAYIETSLKVVKVKNMRQMNINIIYAYLRSTYPV